MIFRPPYKCRSLTVLTKALHNVQNKLEMRDWQIVIESGRVAPSDFKGIEEADGVAYCRFDPALHTAYIWLNMHRAKEIDADPLWLLMHEVGHIFHDLHDEETRCNIIASLLY